VSDLPLAEGNRRIRRPPGRSTRVPAADDVRQAVRPAANDAAIAARTTPDAGLPTRTAEAGHITGTPLQQASAVSSVSTRAADGEFSVSANWRRGAARRCAVDVKRWTDFTLAGACHPRVATTATGMWPS